jgi:hypothetical protein
MGILEKIKDIEAEVRCNTSADFRAGDNRRAHASFVGWNRQSAGLLTDFYCLLTGFCWQSGVGCIVVRQMARTQKNKATEYHLGLLKAKLAKLRTELMDGGKGGGAKGEGFDVLKSGDARCALIGFPSVGKVRQQRRPHSAISLVHFVPHCHYRLSLLFLTARLPAVSPVLPFLSPRCFRR